MPFARREDSDGASNGGGIFGSLRGHKRNFSKGRRTPSIVTAIHVPSRQELTNLAREDPNALPEEPTDSSSSETGNVHGGAQGSGHMALNASGTSVSRNDPAEPTDSTPPTPGMSVSGSPAHGETAVHHAADTSPPSEGHKSVKSVAAASVPVASVLQREGHSNTGAIHESPSKDSADAATSAHKHNGASATGSASSDHASVAGDRPHELEATQPRSTQVASTVAKRDDFEGGVYRQPGTNEETEVGDDHKAHAVVQPRKSGSGQEDGNDNESWEGAHNARRTETFDSMFSNFTTASSKRNAEFHSVFPEAPADEYLIEDYGCSAIREHFHGGRLYLAENNLYFYSSIFGWVTSYIIPFSEVTSIEKRMTALVIPNGIQVTSTKDKPILFTSFLSRDQAYEKIVQIWKLANPSLEDHEEADMDEKSTTSAGAHPHHHHLRLSARVRLRRKIMERINQNAQNDSINETGGDTPAEEIKKSASRASAAAPKGAYTSHGKADGQDHPKTECDDMRADSVYSTVVMDETFGTGVETMHNLLYTTDFVKDFLTTDQKLINVKMSDWSKSNGDHMRRDVTYIKPLNGSVGPKQTKCAIEETILHADYDHHSTTLTTTRTPDVPSGNAFVVRTRTCLVWGGGWRTRVVVTCGVEWSGRSWLKSVIDKAAIDGQKEYYKALGANIRRYMKEHSHEFGGVDDKVSDDTNKETPSPDGENMQGSDLQHYLAPVSDKLSKAAGLVVEQVQKVSPITLVITGLVLMYLVLHGFHLGTTGVSSGASPSLHKRLHELNGLGKTDNEQDHTIFEVVRLVLHHLRHPGSTLHAGPGPALGLHGLHHAPSAASVTPPSFTHALHRDPAFAHSNAMSEINRLIAWIEFQERNIQGVRNELATLRANYHALGEKLKQPPEAHP